MKNILLIGMVVALAACHPESQLEPVKTEVVEEKLPENFNAALAEELGADDYGMKKYVLALLKRGPNREFDADSAAQLQRAHLDNIFRLYDEGKMALSGPMLDDGDLRGIYVFNVETVEEAEALVNTDPAIQAGSLVMELRPWYGPAGLLKIREIHETVARKAI